MQFRIYERIPWRRFLARVIDVNVFLFPYAFLAGYLFGWTDQAYTLVFIPMALFSEILTILLFGNSLGKKLCGIKICTFNGDRPDIKTLGKRFVNLWFFGMGVGFPLFSIVGYYLSFNRLNKGRRARWDEEAGTYVISVSNADRVNESDVHGSSCDVA